MSTFHKDQVNVICNHNMSTYEGLIEKYEYCTLCGKKESVIQAQAFIDRDIGPLPMPKLCEAPRCFASEFWSAEYTTEIIAKYNIPPNTIYYTKSAISPEEFIGLKAWLPENGPKTDEEWAEREAKWKNAGYATTTVVKVNRYEGTITLKLHDLEAHERFEVNQVLQTQLKLDFDEDTQDDQD
jgi:hypothetical protein